MKTSKKQTIFYNELQQNNKFNTVSRGVSKWWAAKNFFNFKWVAKKKVWEPMVYKIKLLTL
jgi:hypothetical protein